MNLQIFRQILIQICSIFVELWECPHYRENGKNTLVLMIFVRFHKYLESLSDKRKRFESCNAACARCAQRPAPTPSCGCTTGRRTALQEEDTAAHAATRPSSQRTGSRPLPYFAYTDSIYALKKFFSVNGPHILNLLPPPPPPAMAVSPVFPFYPLSNLLFFPTIFPSFFLISCMVTSMVESRFWLLTLSLLRTLS